MSKVFLICGKICSGKSAYAGRLCAEYGAVLLSVDEIMLAMFGQHCGEKHDEYTERTKDYLYEKSLEIVGNGINVVLDWGFWRKSDRAFARRFYADRNTACEFHYIDVDDGIWKTRIEKRNCAVSEGKSGAYYVDGNLAAKFSAIFEQPDRDEIDVWVKQYENLIGEAIL